MRGLPTPAAAAADPASHEDGPGLLRHTSDDGYTIVTSIGDSGRDTLRRSTRRVRT